MQVLRNAYNNQIGSLKESSLHASLKLYYKEPGDKIEVRVDNYIIDIVRNNLLIEIQTKNFSAIRDKLGSLLKNHRVLLVYPIIRDKWVVTLDSSGKTILRRRKSPQHNTFENIFEELIRIPHLISNPNLIIEALLVQIEEIRLNNGQGSWRRHGISISDRKLIAILDQKLFSNPQSFLKLLPASLEKPFTNQDLANYLNNSLKLARMMTYCFRKMGLLKVQGKRGRAFLFDL